MSKIPAIFSWSGGKDSSYALQKIFDEGVYEVRYLLSTINGHFKRLSMHGIREELMEAQASSIGIPLLKMYVFEASNEEYGQQMNAMLLQVKEEGINHIIFGDIFLEDIRRYREERVKLADMHCVFPIWKIDTKFLINDFIANGFKTCICCINDGYLDESWCGKIIDDSFLSNLPENIDPCGENGEFHSFCFEAPFFKKSMNIKTGEKIYKALELNTNDQSPCVQNVTTRGFWFTDILLSKL